MGSSPPRGGGGFVPDLATCRLMSVNEKRELVRELSKCHRNAPEQLQEWTRREISQVLFAELGRKGKETTFSSMPKRKMLDLLFKVMNGESSFPRKYKKRKSNPELIAFNRPTPFKRQRKNGSSSLIAVMARTPALTGVSALTNNAHLCQNSACTATINPGDEFCKRCSCCICFKYDDNKDPTLLLFCNSDQSLQEDSCGFSCHLECAIEDERSGIQQSGQCKKLDGDYFCTQCGKQNDLLRCLEKQLQVAKNARRLDVLCHRIFLGHKILISTKKYLVLHDIVDTAMKKLEAEVGPITGIRDMGHELVARLVVGAEVQKLCIYAIETVHSLFSGSLTADLQIQRSCITQCSVPTSKSQTSNIGDVGETKVQGVEKSPGVSAAAVDEEHEIPRSYAQADLLRNNSSLMVYNRGTLKQNLDMIFTMSEIATRACTGNMLADPPENSWSLVDIIAKRTENHNGDSGKSSEAAKSGDHVPHNRYLNAETNLESLSRFEDGRHKSGPADPSAAVQISLHRESSNLVLNNRETFQQIPHADAARLNNSSDAHNESEFACQKTENEIKYGNGNSAMSSKLETCNHIPEAAPSHVQTEVIARNHPVPRQDLGTSVSPSLAGAADTVTEVVSPEVALMGGPSPTRRNNLYESEQRELCSLVIKVEDLLRSMDAQIRVLEAQILLTVDILKKVIRNAIECSLRDLLVKVRVLYPAFDVQSLLLPLEDGDYTKLSDEVQPIAVELSKQMRLTVNWEGDSGNIYGEGKSGDPRSSSCRRTSGRFEDGAHESGPAEPNTTVQTALHRESSDLMLSNKEAFQQNLNADAAMLENASDVPCEYEFPGSHPYCLKPETEPDSSSNKSLSGKPDEISRKDGHSEASYEYCVKVIRRLECEGHINASFRVKFLTCFCLRATHHERRMVRVYVDTLIDDPVSLAARLDDTFSDAIYDKRPHRAPSGFCWELWH